MTRRERLTAKVERRVEWAARRRQEAAGLLKRNEDRAFEHLRTAQHHEAKADGLAQQIDASVYSDDADAVQQLEARIAEREAERDRIKAYNATCRAAVKAGRKMGDTSLLDEQQREDLKSCAIAGQLRAEKGCPFPGYVLSNLGGRIAADRERIKAIQAQADRRAGAEAAGGVKILRSDDWCTVTFAEKPSREILDALRAAGYGWGGGSWSGYLDKLPAEVEALAGGAR